MKKSWKNGWAVPSIPPEICPDPASRILSCKIRDADPYGALTEIPLSGTDQKLFSNRPDFHSDLLRRGGGAAIWEFVQTAGPDKTICYYGGSLFVFASGDSLDTRQNLWKRFDPQEYIGNAVRILQTMDAVERLAQFIPGEDTAGTP